jgi:hypothetical protein
VRRLLIGGVIAASVVACALFPSLDGLSGDAGVDDVVTKNDASGDAPADAPTDSKFDAADTATDAGLSFSCASVDAAFCDDFDDSDASTFTKWSKENAFGGGTVTRIASDASPPFAAEFSVPASDGGTIQANIQHSFISGPKTFARYAFDLRVAQYPTTGSFNITPVALSGSSTTGAVDAIALKASTPPNFVEQLQTDGGGSTIPHALVIKPVQGQWTHVRIEWTIAATITVHVYFGAMDVSGAVVLDPSSAFTSTPSITAGISFEATSSNGAIIDVDNVTFEMQ